MQTCKYKNFRQKLKYIMRELNKIEVHTMTIFLKKRKVDTFEKQQHIMACLNQEVKEMKNRKGKIEIISVFLIPLLMNLVITGGEARFIINHIDQELKLIYDEDLLLDGLNIIYQKNKK